MYSHRVWEVCNFVQCYYIESVLIVFFRKVLLYTRYTTLTRKDTYTFKAFTYVYNYITTGTYMVAFF